MEKKKPIRKRKEIMPMDIGKLPPQAIDLEEAVLGALLLESTSLRSVRSIIEAKVFYKEIHQKIYQAIIDLDNESTIADILTVTHKLKQKGELDVVGGAYFISQLTNRVASAANIEVHSMIIFECHLKREQIRFGSEMIKQGYDDTVDVLDTNQMISKMANDVNHE